MQALIRDNQTTKQYLTLLRGTLRRATFDVNAPLRKSVLQGGERMVRVDDDGKAALTRFESIEAYRDATLAEVDVVHRAHASDPRAQRARRHPIAGDEKYGEREFNQRMREFGLRRLFLHAARFEFALGDKTYSFSAPLAADLARRARRACRPGAATGKNAR